MKIGITFSETNYQNYPDWIKGNDSNIKIIELSYENQNYEEVANCDAIILTGGVDFDPKEKLNYPNMPKKFNLTRDIFETEVLRLSFEHKKPILGICRGMQLINVYKGGTLHLDNGIEKNKIHKHENSDKTHSVQVIENSLFYKIVNQKNGEVNSAHHQSIDKLGADLKAVAYSPDGVIEAIEYTNDKQSVIGVQWHPERMSNLENPFSQNLRDFIVKKLR